MLEWQVYTRHEVKPITVCGRTQTDRIPVRQTITTRNTTVPFAMPLSRRFRCLPTERRSSPRTAPITGPETMPRTKAPSSSRSTKLPPCRWSLRSTQRRRPTTAIRPYFRCRCRRPRSRTCRKCSAKRTGTLSVSMYGLRDEITVFKCPAE